MSFRIEAAEIGDVLLRAMSGFGYEDLGTKANANVNFAGQYHNPSELGSDVQVTGYQHR